MPPRLATWPEEEADAIEAAEVRRTLREKNVHFMANVMSGLLGELERRRGVGYITKGWWCRDATR